MAKSSLVGGFNPSDTYDSQLGLLFTVYGKMFSQASLKPTAAGPGLALNVTSDVARLTRPEPRDPRREARLARLARPLATADRAWETSSINFVT